MEEPFQALVEAARGLDLADAGVAQAELARRLPPDSPEAQAVNRALVDLLEAGRIADRGELPVRWGRVAKASEDTAGYSIDAVHMTGAGPRHRHPKGEIDWCVPLEGEPTFDGCPAGWLVLGEDSVHVPTVAGGAMLVVYLLPGGEIEFLEPPA